MKRYNRRPRKARTSDWYTLKEIDKLLNNLVIGDLIETETDSPYIHHWDVYIGITDESGDHMIVDRTGRANFRSVIWRVKSDVERIETAKIDELFRGGRIKCRKNNSLDSYFKRKPWNVIKRNTRIHPYRHSYHAFFMNCETFAYHCRYERYFPGHFYYYLSISIIIAVPFVFLFAMLFA